MPRWGRQTRIKFVGGDLLVKVSGNENILANLTGIVARSKDLRIPFNAFRPVWINAIQEAWDSGGEPVPWPALSPAYAAWKQSAYPGKPIMRLTDRLYDSLTSQTSDTIWFVGPKSMQLGTRVPYFIYHQTGTNKMPARPVLTLPAHAAAALVTMVLNYAAHGKPSKTRRRRRG
jgi:phage gpG-like protein